jgi:hypothetical protein
MVYVRHVAFTRQVFLLFWDAREGHALLPFAMVRWRPVILVADLLVVVLFVCSSVWVFSCFVDVLSELFGLAWDLHLKFIVMCNWEINESFTYNKKKKKKKRKKKEKREKKKERKKEEVAQGFC